MACGRTGLSRCVGVGADLGAVVSRMDQLRAQLDRAKDRLSHCRRQRQAYESYADSTERAQRTLRKLREDEQRAELDCCSARHQFEQAREVEGLNL
jgi:flagellar biosynthesis chaperone FliJ